MAKFKSPTPIGAKSAPAVAAAASAKPWSAPAGSSSGSSTAKPTAKVISSADRHKMIAEAAYFIAQRRGFSGGSSHNDWVAAEKQINEMLKKS